jgi:NAD(P)-dependent dehydrogenase (short-subunit alcohol dehydrogenase family)
MTKTAMVTGAARGIGAELARQLATAGFEVIVTARDLAATRPVVASIRDKGGIARAAQLDVTDPDSITALTATVDEGSLDILVNNAAAFADWNEVASTADLRAARAVMETNLFGTWAVIQAALPALRRSDDARIINVGSGSGSHGEPTFGLATNPVSASYAISKAALHALTAKLATELRPEGIRVDVVDPGLTATAPGMDAMGARPVAEGARSILHAILLPATAPTGTFTRDGQPLPW